MQEDIFNSQRHLVSSKDVQNLLACFVGFPYCLDAGNVQDNFALLSSSIISSFSLEFIATY
jgi:hypothetical protein